MGNRDVIERDSSYMWCVRLEDIFQHRKLMRISLSHMQETRFRTFKTQQRVTVCYKALNISLQTLQSWDPCVNIPLITLKPLHVQTITEQKHVS